MLRKLTTVLRKSFKPDSFPAWIVAAVAIVSLIYQFTDRQYEKTRYSEEIIREYEEELSKLMPLFYSSDVEEIVRRSRCEFLIEKDLMSADTDCSSLTEEESGQMADINLNSQQREELRDRLDEVLKVVPLNKRVALDWLKYYEKIVVCGRFGVCDSDFLRTEIQNEATAFLNNVCTYVKPGRALENSRKEIEELAKFLLDDGSIKWWWSEDEGRENLFFCPYLRDIEETQSAMNS